jgi:hypothetical protein
MKDWDAYFMDLAEWWPANRSCLRRQFGSVLSPTADRLTGFKRPASGVAGERGHATGRHMTARHECYTVRRAEHQSSAGKHGGATGNTTLYCTSRPCGVCLHLIVQASVRGWSTDIADWAATPNRVGITPGAANDRRRRDRAPTGIGRRRRKTSKSVKTPGPKAPGLWTRPNPS